MRTPRPLPASLQGRVLTPERLGTENLHRSRLHRNDIAPLARGVHIERSHVPADTVARLRQRAIILGRREPDSWISHVTAAIVRGWWLPNRLFDVETVHLTTPKSAGTRPRGAGLVSHRVTRHPHALRDYGGAWISAPEQTWLELASALSRKELVALGDQILRRPYERYEGRTDPWTSIDRLRAVIGDAAGTHGVKRARQAVELVRVGADSAQETALRLAVIDAGLPEPELQVPAVDGDPSSPRADLGDRRRKIAMQYDGSTHFDPEKARRDQRRDNAFIAAGWTLLRFNREDARDDFTEAVRQIRAIYAAISPGSSD